MSLHFVLDPDLTPTLRAQIVDLWVDVTNAGGAVGFVAPVTAAAVRPTAEATFADLAEGPDRLLVGYEGDRLVGRLGYREVGRLPRALRLAPDDDRDEVFMWLDLAQAGA